MRAMVSVIIPVYNVLPFLPQAVESALGQMYRDIEVILVDDGSTDGCSAVCDEFAARDARVHVIHKQNGGLSSARNAGLDAAVGKFVYFLDSDDYIDRELLETALQSMRDTEDMVYFGYKAFTPDGTEKQWKFLCTSYTLATEDERYAFIVQKLLRHRIGWEAWNRVYRRDVIEKYGLRFVDNNLIFAEDLYFNLCYCMHAEHISGIEGCLYHYRERDDSIMGRQKTQLNLSRMNELGKAALAFAERFSDCQTMVSHFPVIHYLIMRTQVKHLLPVYGGRHQYELRQILMDDLCDKDFFVTQMVRLLDSPEDLHLFYSESVMRKRCSEVRYLITGDPADLRAAENTQDAGDPELLALLSQKGKEFIYYLGSEEYGNIGDMQINEATVHFLQKNASKKTVIEVTGPVYALNKGILLQHIKPWDLIVMPGGGNFGDEYESAELIREDIVRTWPCNRKVMFPQTAWFTDTERGKSRMAEAKRIYTKENCVTLFAREEVSYRFMKENFDCDVFLAPDIVLSENLQQPEIPRKRQAVLCLRDDLESVLPGGTKERLVSLLTERELEVVEYDLQLSYCVRKEERKKYIDQAMDLWRSSRLVITDRLHGMIFAAVTGTPCLAFSNYNPKISGSYKWLKALSYIRYANEDLNIEQEIDNVLRLDNNIYDERQFDEKYIVLKHLV